MANYIMVVGTSSNSGKTTLVTGLCRLLANQGYEVAPFKSQNMSLNSRVAKEDGEIAVAQYTQSLAAKQEPSIHFNPILLKPKGNFISQVIVHGKPFRDMNYNEYRENKNFFLKKIKESLEKLKNYDYVIMEGAGSCCELNLLEDDIANLRIAEIVKAKAILVADIDRGGVFASIYGTLKLLPERWRKLIKGIVINKFRGNLEVLKDGIEKIEELTGVEVLGVLPYDEHLTLPEEDSQSLSQIKYLGDKRSKITVDVVRFKKIANFSDIDPLRFESFIRFIDFDEDIGGDILILPGSRSSTTEAHYLNKNNFSEKVREFLNEGGILIGICGGYQTLGEKLLDPNNRENFLEEVEGLKILEAKTTFEGEKVIKNSIGIFKNYEFLGYEIHEGRTYTRERRFLKIKRGFGDCGDGYDGSIKKVGDGLVIGTYFHGILENTKFREYILNKVCERKGLDKIEVKNRYREMLEKSFNHFAKVVKENLNLEILFS